MAHWLERLLSPRSIAIVGASERAGSLAAATQRQLTERGFGGDIFPVNPRYAQIFGLPCAASLGALPAVPDLVVYAISGRALEQSFDEALALGVGGILVYAANYVEDDAEPRLTERLRRKAAAAGIPVCGGNSMGFYNYDDDVFVSFDRPPADREPGNIALILHSGSGMTYLANNDARFAFNYVIASAQETNATLGDYMDYLLERDSTRVIAILLETVRDVPAFVAALDKARARDVPVVITPLGRSARSAEFARSHSGAIVGNHEAFVAVCERYGALLCRDADELIVTAMLFASGRRAHAGGISAMLDSGGMREQMIDLAEDYGLRFADISPATTAVLRAHLEGGLDAVNPMDGMGALGRETETTYLECGKALLDDPDTALLGFEFEFRDGFSHYPELFGVARQLAAYSDKPLVLVNSCAFASIARTAAELTREGIPVVNGIDVALRALRNLMAYAAAPAAAQPAAAAPDTDRLAAWRGRLARAPDCDEITSLELMADFGLPVVDYRLAVDLAQLRDAAAGYAYPLALKTAADGIAHKSERDGVRLGIRNQLELEAAYHDISERLGARVVLMPMAGPGVEVALGMNNDPQYGPLVVVACGGVLIELLAERAFALAPVDRAAAECLIDRTRLGRLLAGVRGRPAADRGALVDLVVEFSRLAAALGDVVAEIDLNPVIVNPDGCTIVDALVVPARDGKCSGGAA